MMGYLVYFNVFQAKDIINSSYNVRLDSMKDRVIRGEIFDRDGNVLAKTNVAEDGSETREYPYGCLYAHIIGYDSHGKSGLESTANFDLLSSNAFFIEKIFREFKEEKNIGNNVITTLDTEIQKAAHDALGTNKGAVVVMEVTTGKILAMVSKPDYDPNTVVTSWETLTSNADSVLWNRATQGAYAPGSVYKIVTALAYMRENSNYQNYHFNCTGEYSYDGTVIHCANGRVHGEEDLVTAFANSCNGAFCEMGLNLNFKKYKNTAEELLFNSKLPCVIPYATSKFQLTQDSATYEIMMTAMGQGETQVSPYHMALIAAAIGNGGMLMEPYVVEHVENYSGVTVDKNMPKKYSQLMTSTEASQLKTYMQAVVESGTGSTLKNNKYTVAGKTGTAEYSSDKDKSHSWFMGFTNVENPEIAISVVVEGADKTGVSAVSVAKKVFDACY